MEKLLLLFMCAFIAIQAQEHRHCEAPPYFQGQVLDYDHVPGLYKYSYVSYDAIGKRVRTFENFDENATRPQVDELILFEEKRRYRVDLKTRKCNVTVEEGTFRPIATPDHSRFNGEFVVGLEEGKIGEGLRLGSWTHAVDYPETKIAGNITYSFALHDCVPVAELFIGESTDPQHKQVYHVHRDFFDVTVGLNDPNVFDVPMECHNKDKLHFET